MVGFLPNLLTFNRSVNLSFSYQDPNLNVYPNKNWVADHFFHYYPSQLYRIQLGRAINPHLDDNSTEVYLIENRAQWELVSPVEYVRDELNKTIELEIENFYYLYFLASERWVLKRDESVSISIEGNPWNEMISWENKDLVTDLTPTIGSEEVDFFLTRSRRGFMKIEDQNTYYFYDDFDHQVDSELGAAFNRILFTLEFPESSPGSYQLSDDQLSVGLLRVQGNSITSANYLSPQTGVPVSLLLEEYGEIRDFVKGTISGEFINEEGEIMSVNIRFNLLRTR